MKPKDEESYVSKRNEIWVQNKFKYEKEKKDVMTGQKGNKWNIWDNVVK